MPTENFGDFEWDSEKRTFNLEKHQIDFCNAVVMFHGTLKPVRRMITELGEKRIVSIGKMDGLLFIIVYTMREHKIRIISVRRANRDEYHYYTE